MTSRRKDQRKILRDAQEDGWRTKQTRNGYFLLHEDGVRTANVHVSGGSDSRTLKNLKADLQRSPGEQPYPAEQEEPEREPQKPRERYRPAPRQVELPEVNVGNLFDRMPAPSRKPARKARQPRKRRFTQLSWHVCDRCTAGYLPGDEIFVALANGPEQSFRRLLADWGCDPKEVDFLAKGRYHRNLGAYRVKICGQCYARMTTTLGLPPMPVSYAEIENAIQTGEGKDDPIALPVLGAPPPAAFRKPGVPW